MTCRNETSNETVFDMGVTSILDSAKFEEWCWKNCLNLNRKKTVSIQFSVSTK